MEERRKGERRVDGPTRDEHNRVWRKPDYWEPGAMQNWYNWREDRRRAERRKGE